jgi:bleomycin hydrolase
LFGTLNLFRFEARGLLNLQGFEFSEAYPYFFHLLEQCNAFMEFTIETSDRPTDDRLVALKLDEPIADAGDWGIAVNLIRKYGLLPKSAYPESYSSCNTGELIDVLTDILRVAAYRLRAICNKGGQEDAVDRARQHKAVVLCRAFQILCIHLGSPPTIFTWKWRDDDGTFHDMQHMTPQQFADTFVDPCYNSYVALLQDPRHAYDRLYCVEYVNTVIGQCDLRFLNVTADEMKRISLAMLQDGCPVWFACNVDTQCDHDLGLWDANLYDREGFYSVDDQDEEGSSSIFGPMSKKDWILFGAPIGTHVMLITGVDVENGVPVRWRVENSWGTKYGDDGYYTMNDNWFDEYVFEIIAPPAYLSDADCDALTKDPVVLPGWDPMSTTVGRRRNRR